MEVDVRGRRTSRVLRVEVAKVVPLPIDRDHRCWHPTLFSRRGGLASDRRKVKVDNGVYFVSSRPKLYPQICDCTPNMYTVGAERSVPIGTEYQLGLYRTLRFRTAGPYM